MKITFVILCGGSGKRLWPLSRQQFPKQFLKLFGEHSLFQQTLLKTSSINNDEFNINEILVITNENHRFLVKDQISELQINVPIRVILEPTPKNTAPALTLAALASLEETDDNVMVVLPSDHFIGNNKKFTDVLSNSISSIQENLIIMLGVHPSFAETGFGYIKFKNGDDFLKDVDRFIEKPDESSANEMLDSGDYLWNAGLFILSAKTWIKSIHAADLGMKENILSSWKQREIDDCFIRPNEDFFKRIIGNSIDYAVIERHKYLGLDLKIAILDADWSDVGSFIALENILGRDNNLNTFSGDVESINSTNNIAYSTKKNISLVGVKDMIIIETSDAVLVANKNSSQDIKKIVDHLDISKKHLTDIHRKVFRPWGWYEIVDESPNVKVKRIHVNPNSKLSYQSHNYRNEHWVVIKGKATIICDNKTSNLNVDESTYIEKGMKHKLMNLENDILEIIEVQTGIRVDESDIIRYEDDYGRV